MPSQVRLLPLPLGNDVLASPAENQDSDYPLKQTQTLYKWGIISIFNLMKKLIALIRGESVGHFQDTYLREVKALSWPEVAERLNVPVDTPGDTLVGKLRNIGFSEERIKELTG